MEGELADNQYLAVCFKNGFVHYAVFVIENAQVDYLLAKPVDIFFPSDSSMPTSIMRPFPMEALQVPLMVTEACPARCITTLMLFLSF